MDKLGFIRLVPVGSGNLRITNMQPADEGSYICTVENGVARISASAKVTVQSKIVISKWHIIMLMILVLRHTNFMMS